MKTETANALASYVKSLSGTQVTEAEAVRLQKIIPGEGDAPSVFETKLRAFERIVRANKRAFKKAILQGQPLKAGTIIGLDKAENEIAGLSSSSRINNMDSAKRKRYEAFKAGRNK